MNQLVLMTKGVKLHPRQVHAIAKKRTLAQSLMSDTDLVGKIVTDYRKYSSLSEIAKKYIPEEYKKSVDVAKGVVGLILKKSFGSTERELLEKEHRRKGGERVRDNKKGIYTEDKDERAILMRRRGLEPWDEGEYPTERDIALLMALNKKYHTKNGAQVSWENLTEKLNEVCHGGKKVRTKRAVRSAVEKYENKLLGIYIDALSFQLLYGNGNR